MSHRTRKTGDIRRRAYAPFRMKRQDKASRIIEGIATTPTPDRIGDIVEPLGAKFNLPMPLLWQHNPNMPVGHVIEAEATTEGIKFKARIESIDESGTLKDRLDEAWQSVSKGLVRAVSIGFSSKEPPELLRNGSLRFLSWDWFELSLMTIPANTEATIDTIKSLARAQSAASGRPAQRTASKTTTPPAAAGSRKSPAKGDPVMAKSTAEKIKEVEEEIEGRKARMAQLLEEAEDEEKELTEDEEKELDESEEEVKSLTKTLRRLKMISGNDNDDTARGTFRRVKAADVDTGSKAAASRGGDRVHAEPKKPSEKEQGLSFARMVKCFAIAKGNPMQAFEIAKNKYPHEKDVQAVFKAQIAGASVEDPGWAGYLAEPDNFMAAFIEFLRPQTIVGKFGTDGVPALKRVPFNIKVPRQTSGGSADWVGEGKAKPVTSWLFDQVELRFHKLAAITVLSEELLRHAHMSADMMIRD
jgi:HK97 family phage prohead protease